MLLLGCDCKNSCVGLAIFSSIIVGIVTGFLVISATITVAPAFLWVLLGVALGFLAITLISVSLFNRVAYTACICRTITSILVGALGTVLLSSILLGIVFPATSFLGAFIAGLLGFFFSLTVISVACLVRCIASCDN